MIRKASTAAPVSALEWEGDVDGHVVLLDQTLLPQKVKHLEIGDLATLIRAIRRLSVRGAPAIGCAAAYGMVIGLRSSRARGERFRDAVDGVRDKLAASRPTAVNLFWAIDRMREVAFEMLDDGLEREDVLDNLLDEARAIHEEDQLLCQRIGDHGARLLRSGQNVLTHCNAGALATGGLGTALAVVYRAVEKGKRIRVFADETRPLLQGARLTTWELREAGVDVTLICDNAAASIMAQGEIHCVVVGADRIAMNGDAANKIGTYGVAVLAKEHGIPFYVAAPTTTIDRAAASGADIPIEERADEEVAAGFGKRTAPEGVDVRNPAFDVTPARLIAGIITEHGVVERPYRSSLKKILAKS